MQQNIKFVGAIICYMKNKKSEVHMSFLLCDNFFLTCVNCIVFGTERVYTGIGTGT